MEEEPAAATVPRPKEELPKASSGDSVGWGEETWRAPPAPPSLPRGSPNAYSPASAPPALGQQLMLVLQEVAKGPSGEATPWAASVHPFLATARAPRTQRRSLRLLEGQSCLLLTTTAAATEEGRSRFLRGPGGAPAVLSKCCEKVAQTPAASGDAIAAPSGSNSTASECCSRG
ncbi:hypothetical protein cyc_09403 [Cyclospora cayetanensis]|uniref:Uncharacterized protein n=1 Tax=Cyclospora cayetanensis TaxID=88456 RepID=A0A1D3D8X4_9EIME|nr:hypothetical protein cyc_09403 [Cyclospora cayetanensis]